MVQLQEKVNAFKKQSESLYIQQQLPEEAVPLATPISADDKLATTTKNNKKQKEPLRVEINEKPLNVQIEAKTMSLACKYLDNRDRDDLTEG